MPALRALRAAFPEAEITLIGLPWAAAFARRFAVYVDRFVAFPGYPGIAEAAHDPARTAAFLAAQRTYGYDLAIQLHGSGEASNPFVAALGARLSAGFYRAAPPAGFAVAAPYPDDQPEVLRNLALVALLGCPVDSPTLAFPLEAADFAEADRLLEPLAGVPHPWVGLHPGARSPARRWPVGRFAALARALAARWGARIVLTGGHDEEGLARAVADEIEPRPLVVAGRTSLGGLAALIARLDLFISNDTGPAHLAAALDVPSVTIFGPADPRRWAPLDTERHPIVRRRVACSPCAHWECPIDHRCLRTIASGRVLAVAERLLGEGGHPCGG